MAKGMVMEKSYSYSSKACFVNHFNATFQAGKHINNLQRAMCMFPNAFLPAAWNSRCDRKKNFSLLMKLNIDHTGVKLHEQLVSISGDSL